MTKKEELFRHFRLEERMLVDRVLDWMEQSSQRYQSVLTPFLNPREQKITETLVRRAPDLNLSFDGGFPDSERCRGRIDPPFVQSEEDHGLSFLHVKAHRALRHPDVLGSLLGLGIKREALGDILSIADGCQLILAEEMEGFVRSQLNKVGNTPVQVTQLKRSDIILPERKTEDVTVSVASMRVDAIASEAFRLSRNKTVPMIRNGKCQLNWRITDNPSELVEEGDTLSLRGYGRVMIGEIQGRSKKGRLQMKIVRYI